MTSVGRNGLLLGLAVESDGSLLAVGDVNDGDNSNVVIVRYSPDGVVMAQRVIHVGGGAGMEAGAFDVVVLEDHRILVLGNAIPGDLWSYLFILKLLPSLEFDTSFGDGGTLLLAIGDSPSDIDVQPDQRILVLTGAHLYRFLPAGQLDTGFGNEGRVGLGVLRSRPQSALLQQANGQLVVVGEIAGQGVALTAFTQDGRVSPGFGTNGVAVLDIEGWSNGAAVRPDDGIVVVGTRRGAEGTDAVVWRCDADGRLDAGFGTSGRVVSDLDLFDSFSDVIAEPDGRILAAGMRSWTDATEASTSVVARFRADGVPDETFGVGGLVETNPPGRGSTARRIVHQPGRGNVIGAAVWDQADERLLFGMARIGLPSNQPPVISGVRTSPTTLWPANHKLVDVMVAYDVRDDGLSTPVCLLDVASDQPIDGKGDGNTAPDWEVIDSHHVRLRAERAAGLGARIYTVSITCVDTGGLSAKAAVHVRVER